MSFSNPKQKTAHTDEFTSWYPTLAFLLNLAALVLFGAFLYGYFVEPTADDKLAHIKITAFVVLLLANQLITHYGMAHTNDMVLHYD